MATGIHPDNLLIEQRTLGNRAENHTNQFTLSSFDTLVEMSWPTIGTPVWRSGKALYKPFSQQSVDQKKMNSVVPSSENVIMDEYTSVEHHFSVLMNPFINM